MLRWQFAGGSTIGRSHRMIGRNNQDAWCIKRSDEAMVAVVADGCSSGENSEVGAQLGASITTEVLHRMITDGQAIDWRRVERAVTSQIDALVRILPGMYTEEVAKRFLFTLVGVVMTRERTVFFACGDGIVIINGLSCQIGPYPDNQPPYLAYQLLETETRMAPGQIRLDPIWEGATNSLNHFLLGSDGVVDLIDVADKLRPGLEELVGPIERFWTDDRFFRGNPELVNRELKLVGRDWPQKDPNPGLLQDDTTLVVGRRLPNEPGDEL